MITKLVKLLNFKKERLHLNDYLLMATVSIGLFSPSKTETRRIWRP